jgi:hypothetical protein
MQFKIALKKYTYVFYFVDEFLTFLKSDSIVLNQFWYNVLANAV